MASLIGDKDPILIIDPGHGGKDPGGGTNKYWKEKDKVLDISLYQFKRYQELGVPVALTRNTDVYLSANERTKIVRNSGAKYCHSNHLNAGGGQGAEFIHSFYADGKIEKIMREELESVGQNCRRIFERTYVSGGIKYDYYFMHRETGKVITTIIEYGFADNATDTQRVKDNWEKYAEAIVKAFCIQIGHKYVAPGQKPEATPSKPSKEGTYTVKAGDTLWGIATDNKVSVSELKKANKLTTDIIHIGDKLVIPDSKPAPAKPKPKPKPESKEIKVGSKVVLSKSASKYATGETIPSHIKGKSYTIQQVKSDRVLLKEIISWVYKKDVGGGSTPKPVSLKVGTKVKIKSSASKYATGQTIPSYVKGKSYTIQQVKTDRVLLKEILSWVKKSDIQ